jgi:hypothetical protein
MQNIAMPKLKIKMLGFETGEGIFGVGDRGLTGRRMHIKSLINSSSVVEG